MLKTVTVLPYFASEDASHTRQPRAKNDRREHRRAGSACARALIVTSGSLAISAVGGLLALDLMRNVIAEALRFVIG